MTRSMRGQFSMEIKPIHTKADYERTLREIERLWGARVRTRDGDRLDVLATLVEAYEQKHLPIDLPDPIEAIRFRLEQQGLDPRAGRSDRRPQPRVRGDAGQARALAEHDPPPPSTFRHSGRRPDSACPRRPPCCIARQNQIAKRICETHGISGAVTQLLGLPGGWRSRGAILSSPPRGLAFFRCGRFGGTRSRPAIALACLARRGGVLVPRR
jgi:HTH-type transcriptional regulator / antitoxin HigA